MRKSDKQSCVERLESRKLFNGGGLDPDFGHGGIVVTDMSPIASAIDVANALLRQKDGKIIAVGTALGGSPSIAMARYNQDGTLDNTFGVKGKTLAFIYDGPATSAALQPDGKILAAGQINAAGVARFNSDGTVDTTFNTKGYSTVFQTYAGTASAVAVQPDGSIVLSGTLNFSAAGYPVFFVARFTSTGLLDPTFGSGGSALATFAGT